MRAAWASRRARSGTRPKPPGDEPGGSRTHCTEVDETATDSANSIGPIVPTSYGGESPLVATVDTDASTVPVSAVGPTFWFGGAVADANPHKLGQQGFLELQFYPDSFTKNCFSNGGFSLEHAPNIYTACSPVWTLAKQGKGIAEPAAFNGMLTDRGGKDPSVMHAGDIVDVHIWAPSSGSAYQEQVIDETPNSRSSVLVLISPRAGPLTPAFNTNEIGNALDWGAVWDTPMSFVWEIG